MLELHPPPTIPALALASKDAARLLAVSERTLFDLTKRGEIRAVRVGTKLRRYRLVDLEAYIDGCPAATEAPVATPPRRAPVRATP